VQRRAPTSPVFDELRGIQRAHGYLPEAELRALAERLEIPLFRLHAVASFYPHFFLKPPARAEVRVCGDMACHRRGGNDLRELLARIKAVLRRTLVAPAPAAASAAEAEAEMRPRRYRFAEWELDLDARRLVDPSGREVAITGGQFDLLAVFIAHAGRVLSRDFLLEQTRGREAAPFDRTIDVQVGRLRKKLETDVDDPRIIKSVRGAGYILVAPVSGA